MSRTDAIPSSASDGADMRGVTVAGLTVTGPEGTIVEPLDFAVAPGTTLAIIGESGSGKTMTARALTGLLPRGTSAAGIAEIDGERFNLARMSELEWSQIRGRRAVLLLQDPFTSLSPVIRCGAQIAATIKARIRSIGESALSRTALNQEVVRRLEEVRLPASVAHQFPSELSGGMRQRVAIAAALSAEPRLLIADEPTTALDASTQGEVLDLLGELQQRHQMSLVLISHDLGVVAGRAKDLIVMRNGAVVESGDAAKVLDSPSHPYTQALLDANPTIDEPVSPPDRDGAPLLEVVGISKTFGTNKALSDASVTVREGEIVAIIGESGSGKSTFARCIAGLEIPDAPASNSADAGVRGIVRLNGRELSAGRRGRSPSEMQIVFQDPYSTLNPSFTVEQALAEALNTAGSQANAAGSTSTKPMTITELLGLVDLDPSLATRRPSQLSGGQRQRVSIARALAPRPKLLICDESVSALDVSVQAQILELLDRLRVELGLAMLFITHDLGVVARIASRSVVLNGGKVVEEGDTAQILRTPQHPYTKLLVAAAARETTRRTDVSHHGHPGSENRIDL